MKRCSECGEPKPLDQYYFDGLRYRAACKSCHRLRTATYKRQHIDRKAAHRAVAAAIRRGELEPAAECEACGKPGPVQAHHDDYAQPLAVAWLCRPCHYRRHPRPMRRLLPPIAEREWTRSLTIP